MEGGRTAVFHGFFAFSTTQDGIPRILTDMGGVIPHYLLLFLILRTATTLSHHFASPTCSFLPNSVTHVRYHRDRHRIREIAATMSVKKLPLTTPRRQKDRPNKAHLFRTVFLHATPRHYLPKPLLS